MENNDVMCYLLSVEEEEVVITSGSGKQLDRKKEGRKGRGCGI